MASLMPGYEYDIFISYRQKDNKGDRWVSEFVDALKTELESTFKEEISVYFDINPHDGLLETHDVNASLIEKLRCLVFIPIISQTYCDSKSFAWQYEFVAFNKLAKEDKIGRDIRLAGGNVASRILPVKINDLELEDKELLENELGGLLRSIDFIFKSAGVNRPLRANEDHPQDNLSKTYYRDQINKVANAVKEIITAIKKPNLQDRETSRKVSKPKPEIPKKLKPKIIIAFLLVLLLIALGYFFIHNLTKNSDSVEKTIAVLPFQNLGNDTVQLPFCDGFMQDIINNLQKVKSFTVRPRTSSYQYRDTKKSTAIIGKELNVNYLVIGSVGHEGNNLKIWVSLSDTKADKQVWSNDYTREKNQLFSVQSEIAKEIATELKAELSPEELKKIQKRTPENLEAYNYYIQGNYYYWKGNSGDRRTAIGLYEKAIELDPGYALPYTGIAICLLDQYWYYEDHREDILHNSKKAIDKAFKIDPDLPDAHLALGVYYYYGSLNYPEALKEFDLVLNDQPKNSDAILWSAAVHRRAGNWEMAKSDFEKALELDPRRSEIAVEAGETYDMLRDYSKAEEFYNMSIMLLPDGVLSYYNLSRMFLRRDGDMIKAREILVNAARNCKNSVSDSTLIETNVLIDIYEGKYEKALKDLSLVKDVIQTQFYFRPKDLYYATIYGLMKKPEQERAYYDSTRIFLEKRRNNFPDDQRLYSSLGIVYAGLGLREKAIEAGKRGVELMPINKEAYGGVFRAEDLALIYVMVGKYDEAIKQIKYLLIKPGLLSAKILELDPRWAPLRNQPEFKKIMESYSGK